MAEEVLGRHDEQIGGLLRPDKVWTDHSRCRVLHEHDIIIAPPHHPPGRATCARMRFAASYGSVTWRNARRPKPPWLFTAGIQYVSAAATLAAFCFRFSPVTSMTRFRGSGAPSSIRTRMS